MHKINTGILSAVAFTCLLMTLTYSSHIFATPSAIQDIYDRLKEQSGGNLGTQDYLAVADEMDLQLLKLGQGQRYLQESDLAEYRKWATLLNSEVSVEDNGLRWPARRPEDDLTIIKLAIVFNLKLRNRTVREVYNRDFGILKYQYSFITYFESSDLWLALTYVTIKNYPLFLTLLDLNVGRIERLNPPEIFTSDAFVEIMKRSVGLSSDQISDLIRLLDHEKLKVEVWRPDHYGRLTHFYGEIFPSPECADLLTGKYDKSTVDLIDGLGK